MKQHADIDILPICYVNLDEAFFIFALEECKGHDPEELLNEMEETIRTEHGRALKREVEDHPRPVWELSTKRLRFTYQVLPDCIEVGSIISRLTGMPYEPKHDLHAEFTV